MAFLSRLRIFGTDREGTSKEVPIENDGSLPVELNQRTAFNEVVTAEKTAELQYTFPYGVVNTEIIEETLSSGSGSVVNNGAGEGLEISTGVTASSQEEVQTVRFAKYRSAQGLECVFAGKWDSFTHSDATDQALAIFGDIERDAFAFGYSGASEFKIFHYRDGGLVNEYEQGAWNVDTMRTGASKTKSPSQQVLNPAVGNVFKIELQFLGYGAINFFIEDKNTGKFQLVHTIKYTNTNTLTSLFNPSLKFGVRVRNGASGNNNTFHWTSVGLFVQGKINKGGSALTNSHDVSAVNSTLRNGHLMTIRSKSTYGGVDNFVRSFATAISLVNDSTSNEIVYLIEDGTFTGQSFADINTNNSTLDVDVAGTYTLGTGKVLTGWGVPKSGGSVNEIIKDLEYYISAGKTFSLVTGANSNNMTAIFTLSEDF